MLNSDDYDPINQLFKGIKDLQLQVNALNQRLDEKYMSPKTEDIMRLAEATLYNQEEKL